MATLVIVGEHLRSSRVGEGSNELIHSDSGKLIQLDTRVLVLCWRRNWYSYPAKHDMGRALGDQLAVLGVNPVVIKCVLHASQ
jgi:hypothetical protein